MFGNKRFDVDDADNIIIDGIRRDMPLRVDFQKNSWWSPLHGRQYAQVREHAAGDECAQTQAPFARSSIEQQGIQVQMHNRAVYVDPTQETEEEIWKGITSCNDIEQQRDRLRAPNKLVDRLRLLNASHRADNNAHNEMLLIIEKLREADLIIN